MKSSMIDILVSPAFMVFAAAVLVLCIIFFAAKRNKLSRKTKMALVVLILIVLLYLSFIAFVSIMFGNSMPSAPPVPLP